MIDLPSHGCAYEASVPQRAGRLRPLGMLAGVDLLEMDPGQKVPHPQTTTPTGSEVAFVNDVLGNWHRH